VPLILKNETTDADLNLTTTLVNPKINQTDLLPNITQIDLQNGTEPITDLNQQSDKLVQIDPLLVNTSDLVLPNLDKPDENLDTILPVDIGSQNVTSLNHSLTLNLTSDTSSLDEIKDLNEGAQSLFQHIEEGISAWPSIICLALSAMIAAVILLAVKRTNRKHAEEDSFAMPATLSARLIDSEARV